MGRALSIFSVPRPGQWCVVDDAEKDYGSPGPKDGWWWQHPIFDSEAEAIAYCTERAGLFWIAQAKQVTGGWTLDPYQGPYGITTEPSE